MKFRQFYNTKIVVNYYINDFRDKTITAVDMTTGNGNDLYNIASIVCRDSNLYGFDISEKALENTRSRLKEFPKHSIKLVLDSHSKVDEYVKGNIDLAIYNLGFLPGGNKSITTNYKTVLESLEKTFEILNNNGIVIITFYPGHPSGLEESQNIENYLIKLSQKKYNILKYQFINQVNNPPYVVVIERGNFE